MNVFRMDAVGDATVFILPTIVVVMIASLGMPTGQ
jgi:hypothetical protein